MSQRSQGRFRASNERSSLPSTSIKQTFFYAAQLTAQLKSLIIFRIRPDKIVLQRNMGGGRMGKCSVTSSNDFF